MESQRPDSSDFDSVAGTIFDFHLVISPLMTPTPTPPPTPTPLLVKTSLK